MEYINIRRIAFGRESVFDFFLQHISVYFFSILSTIGSENGVNRSCFKIDVYRKLWTEANGSYLILAVYTFALFSNGCFPSPSLTRSLFLFLRMENTREAYEGRMKELTKKEDGNGDKTNTRLCTRMCIVWSGIFLDCRSKNETFPSQLTKTQCPNFERDAVQYRMTRCCICSTSTQPHCLHFSHSDGVHSYMNERMRVYYVSLYVYIHIYLSVFVYICVFHWLRFFDFDGFY